MPVFEEQKYLSMGISKVTHKIRKKENEQSDTILLILKRL